MRFRGGLGRAALGLLISAIAIALVLRSVDVAAAGEALRNAQPQWVALLLVFIVADILLRRSPLARAACTLAPVPLSPRWRRCSSGTRQQRAAAGAPRRARPSP
jgi:hypothetical protein